VHNRTRTRSGLKAVVKAAQKNPESHRKALKWLGVTSAQSTPSAEDRFLALTARSWGRS
jgi:hypothetical protein